jgi:O-antigen/teichoic acid export membrane protein
VKYSRTLLDWGAVITGLVLERVALALALIIIARRVEPIEYGQYISSFSLITFLAVLPGLGLDSWLLTQGRSLKEELEELWSSLIVSRIRALFLWVAGVICLSFFLSKDTYPFTLILIIVIGAAFDSLNLISIATLRCMNRHHSVAFLLTSSSLAVLVAAILLPKSSDTLLVFAAFRASFSALSFFFGSALINIRALFRRRGGGSIAQLIRSARAYFWADISSVIYVRADVNIIGLMVGSIGNSIYAPAINILQMSFLVPRAIFYFIVPRLSAAYRQKSHSRYSRLSSLVVLAQVGVGLPLSLFLYFLGPGLLQWAFGANYAESGKVLTILSLLPVIRSLNFAQSAIIMSSQNQANRTRVQIVAAGFNVVANIVALQTFGILAVAWVYVMSELMLLLGYTWILWDRRNISVLGKLNEE